MSEKRGRPTAYRVEYVEQARKLCLLGATDVQLADFFGVTDTTIVNWRNKHPEFREAVREGKLEADAKVAESLYRRACGYSHDAVKIVADAKTGTEHVVPYVEHYPPDTTACIYWLKNRAPEHWRDKHHVEHSGSVGTPQEMSDDELVARARQLTSRVASLAASPNGNGNGKH